MQQEIDLIIDAKWLLPRAQQGICLQEHAIAIHQGKITALGPIADIHQQWKSKQHLHRTKHVILPGFINAHSHSAMNLLRGYADDVKLMKWLNDYIWPAEQQFLSEDFVRTGSRLAIAEMIKSGTTSLNDMYFYPEITAEMAVETGIRAMIGLLIIEVENPWAKTAAEYFEKFQSLYQTFKDEELLHLAIAPHSTYAVSIDNLKKALQIAEDNDLRLYMHLHETEKEIQDSIFTYQKRPIELLIELGIGDLALTAVHMTQVNEDDIAFLQDSNRSVVHCPESNMKLASGHCPVSQLQDAGINIALGTDGAASNNNLDMMGEMRSAALREKSMMNNAESLPANICLAIATENGAIALGLENKIGTLEVGKSADFIAIDLERIETLPNYDPISQLVYAATRQQISDVWVAGKQLLDCGELTTIDEGKLIADVKVWQEKIR